MGGGQRDIWGDSERLREAQRDRPTDSKRLGGTERQRWGGREG